MMNLKSGQGLGAVYAAPSCTAVERTTPPRPLAFLGKKIGMGLVILGIAIMAALSCYLLDILFRAGITTLIDHLY